LNTSLNTSKKNVVILGTGFAAFSILKKLKSKFYNISVVSPRNHFLFTPLLPSTTVGTIEFRSIIEPIRNLKSIIYYQAECTSIDINTKRIECISIDTSQAFKINYDILIIAVGEVTNTFNIEGVTENSYSLKEVTDARKIRVKVIDRFEKASLPGISPGEKKKYLRFVVCGGGPTGVEFAAELHDFIEEDVKKKYTYLADLTELILIEAGNKILNSFDEKLSSYTMKLFKRQNIILKLNSFIVKISKDHIYVNDGSKFEYGLLVWTTGNIASALIKSSQFLKSVHNKIIVDKYFKVKNFDNIYALGDCSEIENSPLPVTAQVAQQEGKYLGNALNRLAINKKVRPFSFHDLGMLAYVGNMKALADLPQYKGTGFKAFLFWRSVYITRLVSIKNKMLVLFDWFKNIIFGRDISNF
jgi:NADH:ubiquinone reductase (non-electrogenic)